MTCTVDLEVPATALAIAAHPDDVEFGCGGTLAKWAAQGCAIHHLVLTDGSKGSWDPSQDRAQLVAERREEQKNASRALGGRGDVVFLDQVDGELVADLELRGRVAYWIRRIKPDVVLGHDPWKRYRLHPDHRAAGFLTTDAIVAARDPHFHPEHDVPPHRPRTLLLWEADAPTHVEDVAGVVDRKIDALLSHRSQLRSTMDITDERDQSQVERFRGWVVAALHAAGEPAGVAQGEAFARVDRL